jgi:hypothetical protein
MMVAVRVSCPAARTAQATTSRRAVAHNSPAAPLLRLVPTGASRHRQGNVTR